MLVETSALSKTYKIGWFKKRFNEAIKEAEIFINEGETVGVIGESGSGKTTLGHLLTGLLKPDGGRIFFNGKDVTKLTPPEKKDFRRQAQIIFQHPEAAFNPKWKLIRSLVEPYRLHGIPFTEKILLERLEAVGLYAEHLGRYPSQLSGGELQRAAIARVMVLEPKFIVLDEPTSMLDAITQAQIIRLLEAIQRETGVAYLFISHDLELAQLFCRRIYRLVDGKLQEQPTTARSSKVAGQTGL
ncbi:MAG: dipeptide/oligopeptide/nickel ABC transporter ATP-binding protein [Bacillota bacterium]|nr:dipeptide/oligopeptide/nickel ABC transporter ATP-binding protein [Bacillota bacterium]